MRQGRLDADDAGIDIHPLHGLEVLDRVLLERPRRVDRSIVDHHIEAANLGGETVERCVQTAQVGQVDRLDRQTGQPLLFRRIDEGARLAVVLVDGNDPRTGAQKAQRGLRSETAGGTGIENDLACDRHSSIDLVCGERPGTHRLPPRAM